MHSLIVNGRVNVITIMLLLVEYVVLSTSNDTAALDALDRLGDGNTTEIGIGAEAFPVASSGRNSTQRSSSRTELDIYAFPVKLLAHSNPPSAHQVATPRRSHIDTSWECRVAVRYIASVFTILHSKDCVHVRGLLTISNP